MAMDTLLITGSARNDGNTMELVKRVIDPYQAQIEAVDIRKKNIGYFDYEHHNEKDNFIPLAERMVEVDRIIWATPVYWYAMSAYLKTFFDRLTDLITIRKDLGRKLKGKKCFVICCGSDVEIPPGFEEPFKATCNYLDMDYGGCFYHCTHPANTLAEDEAKQRIERFGQHIFSY